MNNIEETKACNLCTLCGICQGICPRKAIFTQKGSKGLEIMVDYKKCVDCGLCLKVCPGMNRVNNEKCENFMDLCLGSYKKILRVQLKDKIQLQQSTSGGAVSGIVSELLNRNEYESAFLVDTYNHSDITYSKRYSKEIELGRTAKSRYVMVSHSAAIEYILKNRNEKVIFVMTGCAVHGLLNVINTFSLKRKNYLIIGLFCDKTMTDNVFDYFEYLFGFGKKLDEIYFRTKEVGGWPGGMRLIWEDGSYTNLPNTERMQVKEYFQPEGCLYCLDKLNCYSDISVGDNYVSGTSDVYGSSSVILRTEKAIEVWEFCKNIFRYSNEAVDKIVVSQNLETRKYNYYFSKIKGISYNVPNKIDKFIGLRKKKAMYYEKLRKINMGHNREFDAIVNDIKRAKQKRWYWRVTNIIRIFCRN